MVKKKFRESFRKNNKNKHPAYVVGEKDDFYNYVGITHSKTTNNKRNKKLNKNPNPDDKKTAYVLPELQQDKKKVFGRRYKNWTFDKKDKKLIDSIKNKKKQ